MNLHCIPREFVGCGEWVEPWGTLHQEEEGNLGTEEEGNLGTGEEGNLGTEEGGTPELEQEGTPELGGSLEFEEEERTPGRVQ